MTNIELFSFLKGKEGTGEIGKYPMFSLEKITTAPQKTDVVVKDGVFYETSNDYVKYAPDNGGETKNPNGVFGSLAWMIKTREELLRVISSFVLHYHHDFFWGNEMLKPVTLVGAVRYINEHQDLFLLKRPVDYSLMTRVTKNKTIRVEGKEYEMRFFFSIRSKYRQDTLRGWLKEVFSEGKGSLCDRVLSEMFLEKFGVSIARRTINKYRRELENID